MITWSPVSRLGVKSGLCRLPEGVTWLQVYGVACLTGIGFTMSLFIGTLAFETPEQLDAVRIGVLMASALSGILGVAVLRRALATPAATPAAADLRNLVNQT